MLRLQSNHFPTRRFRGFEVVEALRDSQQAAHETRGFDVVQPLNSIPELAAMRIPLRISRCCFNESTIDSILGIDPFHKA